MFDQRLSSLVLCCDVAAIPSQFPRDIKSYVVYVLPHVKGRTAVSFISSSVNVRIWQEVDF
jgi:hypothetical protein